MAESSSGGGNAGLAFIVGGLVVVVPLGELLVAVVLFAVLLVEGGPDLLAAHTVIHAEEREADAAAVAMLGATSDPRESELYKFTNRAVRIIEHDDDAGRKAGKRWAALLRPHVESVDGLRLTGLVRADGQPCKDLNDLLLVSESNLRNANLPPVIP